MFPNLGGCGAGGCGPGTAGAGGAGFFFELFEPRGDLCRARGRPAIDPLAELLDPGVLLVVELLHPLRELRDGGAELVRGVGGALQVVDRAAQLGKLVATLGAFDRLQPGAERGDGLSEPSILLRPLGEQARLPVMVDDHERNRADRDDSKRDGADRGGAPSEGAGGRRGDPVVKRLLPGRALQNERQRRDGLVVPRTRNGARSRAGRRLGNRFSGALAAARRVGGVAILVVEVLIVVVVH